MASSACAVTFDNTVKCWGKYIGSSGSTNVPTTIPNLSDVSVLTMGSAHACALKFDGSVWCWGDNSFGQLGVTGIASSATPVRASNITAHLVKINTFDRFSCGVTDEGGVVCWGYNGGGQLGNGTTTYDKVTMDVLPWPYQAHVVGLDHGVRDVSVGGAHACALLDDSTVRCWGANQVGQAGTGSTQSVGSQTPVASTAIGSGVAELKASWHNTCLRYTGGAIKCVGYGYKGALGAGTGAPWEYFGNTMPLPDITIENGFITPSVSPYTATPLPVVGLQNGAQQLSQGYFGACAIASDNLVKCWGMNYNAQRGDDTYNDAWSPVGVHDGR
jgi:alpha-tubulin suppressor-like RCC1 family protein